MYWAASVCATCRVSAIILGYPDILMSCRWQGIRRKDIEKEREKKDEALMKLTTKEREIRKRIEDLIDRNCHDPASETLKPVNAKLPNGHGKAKMNGDTGKKGKKRKLA